MTMIKRPLTNDVNSKSDQTGRKSISLETYQNRKINTLNEIILNSEDNVSVSCLTADDLIRIRIIQNELMACVGVRENTVVHFETSKSNVATVLPKVKPDSNDKSTDNDLFSLDYLTRQMLKPADRLRIYHNLSRASAKTSANRWTNGRSSYRKIPSKSWSFKRPTMKRQTNVVNVVEPVKSSSKYSNAQTNNQNQYNYSAYHTTMKYYQAPTTPNCVDSSPYTVFSDSNSSYENYVNYNTTNSCNNYRCQNACYYTNCSSGIEYFNGSYSCSSSCSSTSSSYSYNRPYVNVCSNSNPAYNNYQTPVYYHHDQYYYQNRNI